jgi:transcriptional regulator with XRE-family HTH domain
VNPPRNIVGPLVRELREKKGFTQEMLAAKLNLAGWDVSRDVIARIEGQVRWVADFEVLKLASVLGVDGPELLRRAEAKFEKRAGR